MTYTYVIINVSKSTYEEIATKLDEAGYDHAIDDDGTLNMHGLALVCEPGQSVEARLQQLEAQHNKLFQDFLRYMTNHP